jgi:NCS1 family nucleobase:cation symporter-1
VAFLVGGRVCHYKLVSTSGYRVCKLHQHGELILFLPNIVAFATSLTMSEYFNFLLLIGSLFVPLFGIVLADYFVIRQRASDQTALVGDRRLEWQGGGLAVWLVGILVYQAITQWAPQIGASIPSFVITFLLYTGLRLVQQQRLTRVPY